MNFNLDELSCAIGLSILSRLQKIIDKRLEITAKINASLEASSVVSPCRSRDDCKPSPLFHTVGVALDKLRVSKKEFAKAVAAEGIWVNPHYGQVVSEWKWIKKYVKGGLETPNAKRFRDRTFNLLFNEKFSDGEVEDIISSIVKVESLFRKNR